VLHECWRKFHPSNDDISKEADAGLIVEKAVLREALLLPVQMVGRTTLFIQWLRHFIQHTKCTKKEPCILVMDGHQSHKSLVAIVLACDNGVIMVTLPPHCIHRMQPLDRTFSKSLKMNYNAPCDDWMHCHPGRRISFFEMAELFHRAYDKSATHEKAMHGFECTGLWPVVFCRRF